MGLAKGRFWLATLMQMTLPGVPSIYYGDEYALEGLSDPGNRRTLPTPDAVHDRDMLNMVRNTIMLRRALPFLVDGTLDAFAYNDDVLCYRRRGSDGQVASVLINHSLSDARSVRVPIEGDFALDLISGTDLKRGADGCAEVRLWPLGSAVVYSSKEQRLQKPLERGASVIAHITSLSNAGRAGTLGAPARRFIDHLAATGLRYWQVLPVNPTDSFGSPYAGPSAFAGNPNLLEETSTELKRAFERFKAEGGFTSREFFEFARENESWLDPYCAFMAVKDAMNGTSRHSWPDELRRYHVDIFADARFADRARYHAFVQFRFEREWTEMLTYAHEKGIEIVGDIPMYVSDDSADAWSEPEMFSLGKDGMPYEIAGVPPDRFSATGQVWGNPTYNWDHMRKDGYVWWLARLRRSFKLYDRVRLDHFLGFHNYLRFPQEVPEPMAPGCRDRASSCSSVHSRNSDRCRLSPRTWAFSLPACAPCLQAAVFSEWTFWSSRTTTSASKSGRTMRRSSTPRRTTPRRSSGSARSRSAPMATSRARVTWRAKSCAMRLTARRRSS